MDEERFKRLFLQVSFGIRSNSMEDKAGDFGFVTFLAQYRFDYEQTQKQMWDCKVSEKPVSEMHNF
ncbi:MAG: hypothetical protein IPI65_17790 [Bacteroidetes bacterium]|nr:hypothetical protein [Bacteroidota bacterium]